MGQQLTKERIILFTLVGATSVVILLYFAGYLGSKSGFSILSNENTALTWLTNFTQGYERQSEVLQNYNTIANSCGFLVADQNVMSSAQRTHNSAKIPCDEQDCDIVNNHLNSLVGPARKGLCQGGTVDCTVISCPSWAKCVNSTCTV